MSTIIQIEITVPADIGEEFAKRAMDAAVKELRSTLKASRPDGDIIGAKIDSWSKMVIT
jgi:hypothetical protein